MILNDFTVEFTETNTEDLTRSNVLARQRLWLQAGMPPSVLQAAIVFVLMILNT